MMSTTVIGLSAGKGLFGSSFFYSDVSEKLSCSTDLGFVFAVAKNAITAKKSSNYSHSLVSNQNAHSVRALKENAATASDPKSFTDQWVQRFDHMEKEGSEHEFSVEALLLLQSLLEKQWELSTGRNTTTATPTEKCSKKVYVTGSQMSARRRRINARKKTPNCCSAKQGVGIKQSKSEISPELLQNQFKGYVKGVTSEVLLTHSEVVHLSKKIKIGLHLEEQKSRLKEKLGSEPSEEQLATYMRISRTELRTKQIECILAREKLTLSNVRLVMSIAQRYDNMGVQMADLIQAGLIGLIRGIEKYDSSRGFKMSTYVYWWIRQGVSRAVVENSRTLRLPNHLHKRQSAIRKAKTKLEQEGLAPSIDNIAESLKISRKKVMNATQASSRVLSLDNGAFPCKNGLHSYIADDCRENNPWHGIDEKAVKDEVNKLVNMSLGERERYVIRLYYGLDKECLIWEDIGKRTGLSRERVRKIGVGALEKLKHAARQTQLEAMLLTH